jgi:hypothetical protein
VGGSAQTGQQDPTPNARLGEYQVTGGSSSAPTTRHLGAGSGGIDWSILAAGFGSGAVLTGFVVLGASQLQRRQARPA